MKVHLLSLCILLCIHNICLSHLSHQRFDGWANNLDNPEWGAAGSDIVHRVTPSYADMTYRMDSAVEGRPNARSLSNAAFAGQSGQPSFRNLTVMFTYFSQMISFEVSNTNTPNCPIEMSKIATSGNDTDRGDFLPFIRSDYNRKTGTSPNNPRKAINLVSAWIDAGFVYGSNKVWNDCLRSMDMGTLKHNDDPQENGPLYNTMGLPLENPPNPVNKKQMDENHQFSFGDSRAHENPGLMSLALLWFRYHNKLAASFSLEHPDWSDEHIFQMSRRRLVATFQSIIMYEYLPVLLGKPTKEYQGYEPHLTPAVSASLEAAALQWFQTQAPPGFYLRDQNCNYNIVNNENKAIRLCNSYYMSQELIEKFGVEQFIGGMTSQIAEAEDSIVVDDVRGYSFGPRQNTRQDLITLIIMRGRDHGVADYNTLRLSYDLDKVESFENISPWMTSNHPQVVSDISRLYNGSVARVDAYVGGLLEGAGLLTSSVGPLFSAILAAYFARIRASDRFWFENPHNGLFTEEEIKDIKKTKLSDVIKIAFGSKLNNIQENVFVWKNGDACPQPEQLRADHMEPCTPYEHYDYFTGSSFSYIGSLVAIGCIPLVCIIVIYYMIMKKDSDRKSEQINYNLNISNNRKASSNTSFQVMEWIGNDSTPQPIEVMIDSKNCSLRVSSSGGERIIKFRNQSTVTICVGNDVKNQTLMLPVANQRDLVIVFPLQSEREIFITTLAYILDMRNIELLINILSHKRLLLDAVTKDKRKSQLSNVLKTIFSKAYLDKKINIGRIDVNNKDFKDILDFEITRDEFSEALGVSSSSCFLNHIYSLVDKKNRGIIDIHGLLYAVTLFSNGDMTEKLTLLFNMYDVRSIGVLCYSDVTKIIKSILEMANPKTDKKDVLKIVTEMFSLADLEISEQLCLQDFVRVLGGHLSTATSISLGWKGLNLEQMEPTVRNKSKKTTRSASYETVLFSSEGINFIKNNMKDETSVFSSIYSYTACRQQHIICLIVFFGVSFILFSQKFYEYAIEHEDRGFRSVGGYFVSLSRGGAAGMSFCFSLILLTMCRNILTYLRDTPLNRYIPFDSSITFHIIVAYTALVFMLLHVIGYCLIFYEVSTQPTEFLCIFREIVFSPEFLPKFHYWLFGTLPGVTGVTLIAVIVTMYLFAQNVVRQRMYEVFWVTHKLFYVLYAVTLLHGSVRLLQEPSFGLYLFGPAIIFTLDKIYSLSRRRRGLDIVSTKLYPSGVTELEFKRPANFDYKSGQWLRVAITSLGRESYHPMTISSSPHENTIKLHIRKCGEWTRGLSRLATGMRDGTITSLNQPKVYIDGPYGSGHQDWNRHEVVILVGGGIGITPYASILNHFMHMVKSKTEYQLKCRKIYFIWTAGKHTDYEWMLDILREIEKLDSKNRIEAHLFHTQLFSAFDLRTLLMYMCDQHMKSIEGKSMFTGLKSKSHFGRPDFRMILRAIVEAHPQTHKFGLFSCGNMKMIDDLNTSSNYVMTATNTKITHFYESF